MVSDYLNMHILYGRATSNKIFKKYKWKITKKDKINYKNTQFKLEKTENIFKIYFKKQIQIIEIS